MNEMLKNLGEKARMAEASVRGLSTNKKNQVLKGVAEKLLSDKLGCPVIKTVSTSSGHEGLKEAVHAAAECLICWCLTAVMKD